MLYTAAKFINVFKHSGHLCVRDLHYIAVHGHTLARFRPEIQATVLTVVDTVDSLNRQCTGAGNIELTKCHICKWGDYLSKALKNGCYVAQCSHDTMM